MARIELGGCALYVLGLAGSPRRHGNTEFLLDTCLEACARKGARAEKIAVADLQVHPCKGCNWCAEHGRCPQRDDMGELYDKLASCDGLIIAAPIFFYGLPAQLKAVIDRCQVFWSLKYRLRQPVRREPKSRGYGVFLSAGATYGADLFTGAVLSVKYLFDALNLYYGGNLLLRGLEGKGEVKGRARDLEEARELGEKLVQAIRITRQGPERDEMAK